MKNLVLIFSVCLIISSCTKTPQSCITADKTIVFVGENISFTSCAIDAKRTSWNFGDGSVSQEANALHSYANPGIYQVQLRVFSNKDKKWDTSTLIVNVKEKIRYLKKIQINSFNINDPNNTSWDAAPASAPDVFVQFGISGSALLNQTNTIQELQLNQCPVFWDFSSVGLPILTNQTWKIIIKDNDSTPIQTSSQDMISFEFNPYTITSTDNVISLISGNYSVEVTFEEY
jgi:PKD repeat protein